MDRPWRIEYLDVFQIPSQPETALKPLEWLYEAQPRQGVWHSVHASALLPPCLCVPGVADTVAGYCSDEGMLSGWVLEEHLQGLKDKETDVAVQRRLHRLAIQSDSAFRASFDADPAAVSRTFDHIDHLRIIWCYLVRDGRKATVKILMDHLAAAAPATPTAPTTPDSIDVDTADTPPVTADTPAPPAVPLTTRATEGAPVAETWTYHCTKTYFWLQILHLLLPRDVEGEQLSFLVSEKMGSSVIP